MPLTPADFIEPAGDLSEGMFPGSDLEEFVTAWLQDAEARTNSEPRQRAWVYHRAYTSIANRIHSGLAREKKGDADASLAADQFTYWKQKADDALTDFKGPTGTPGPVLTRWT